MSKISIEEYFIYDSEQFFNDEEVRKYLTIDFIKQGELYNRNEHPEYSGVYFKLLAQLYRLRDGGADGATLAHVDYIIAYYIGLILRPVNSEGISLKYIDDAISLENDCNKFAIYENIKSMIINSHRQQKNKSDEIETKASSTIVNYFSFESNLFFDSNDVIEKLDYRLIHKGEDYYVGIGKEMENVYFKLLAQLLYLEEQDNVSDAALAHVNHMIAYYVGLFLHPTHGDYLGIKYAEEAIRLETDENKIRASEDIIFMINEP